MKLLVSAAKKGKRKEMIRKKDPRAQPEINSRGKFQPELRTAETRN